MVQVRTLRIGMIGIGVGGAEILPAMEAMDTVEVVAGADVVPTTLERFSQRFPGATTYDSAEALCQDPDVDAVWVSSPNRFHAEHTCCVGDRAAVISRRCGHHFPDASLDESGQRGDSVRSEAARLAGIEPRRVIFSAFVLMGALAGLAALLNAVRFAAVPSNSGLGLELKAVAAVVVGGTAITGGRGTLIGRSVAQTANAQRRGTWASARFQRRR